MSRIQIACLQDFGAPKFDIWYKDQGRRFQRFLLEGFVRKYMMTHVQMCSLTKYKHILLAKFREYLIELFVLELLYASNNGVPTSPPPPLTY